MGRAARAAVEDDYELGNEEADWKLKDLTYIPYQYQGYVPWTQTEQKKQAAADVLYQYSQFVMVCIGEGVRPSDLRMHLMKEISGVPTSLKKVPASTAAASPASSGEPSSSGSIKAEKS